MKKFLMCVGIYTSVSSVCLTCGVEPDRLFSKLPTVQKVLCVVLIMIGTVVAARG